VDVRIIAATNKDLMQEIEDGNFREDLYHRISVIVVHIPTLNERVEDIPILAEKFMEDICQDNGINKKQITAGAMQGLKNIYWSGNIRELRNIVERLVILCDDKITEEDIQLYANNGKKKPGTIDAINEFSRFQDFKDYAEKMFIDSKLKKNNWNVAKTSAEIDIQRSHLYNKIDKFDLKRNSS
jgi:DNA-binding NtrC family response regulator